MSKIFYIKKEKNDEKWRNFYWIVEVQNKKFYSVQKIWDKLIWKRWRTYPANIPEEEGLLVLLPEEE